MPGSGDSVVGNVGPPKGRPVKAKAIGTEEEGDTPGEGNGTPYNPAASSKVLVVEDEPPAGDEESEAGVRGGGVKAVFATAVCVRGSSEDSGGTIVSAVDTEGEGGKPREDGGASEERGASPEVVDLADSSDEEFVSGGARLGGGGTTAVGMPLARPDRTCEFCDHVFAKPSKLHRHLEVGYHK